MKSVIFIPEGKIAYGKLAQALAYGGITLQTGLPILIAVAMVSGFLTASYGVCCVHIL